MAIKEIAAKVGMSPSSIEKKLKFFRELFHAKTNMELVCNIKPYLISSLNQPD